MPPEFLLRRPLLTAESLTLADGAPTAELEAGPEADPETESESEAARVVDPARGSGFSVELEWRNDQMALAFTPDDFWGIADDDGLTNDMLAAFLWRSNEGLGSRTTVRHRMITEERAADGTFGTGRVDELTMVERVDHSFLLLDERLSLTPFVSFGLAFSGHFAGELIQNEFHTAVDAGHRLGDPYWPLQEEYPDGARVGGTLGAGIEARAGLAHWLGLDFGFNTQIAFGGTGTSHAVGTAGVDFRIPMDWIPTFREIQLFAGIDAGMRTSMDEALLIPGGYRDGSVELSPRLSVGIDAEWGRFSYELIINHDGTHSHAGAYRITLGDARRGSWF